MHVIKIRSQSKPQKTIKRRANYKQKTKIKAKIKLNTGNQ